MIETNNGGNGENLPAWAGAENLRISFDYAGPNEVAKALMGYRWPLHGYSLEWLHKRITDYDRDKSAEMAAYGANAACLVWSTGFSIGNEGYHWEIVRRRIAEFHARGMHVLVYLSLTNCFWQEFFPAEPEAANWRQIGPSGEPVRYEGIDYGSGEVTRYLMCVNNPAWLEYQQRRVRAALAAGADGIFWDNNFTKCHCPLCQAKFRQFTRERLGQEQDIPLPVAGEKPPEKDLRSAREVVFDWIPLSHPQARVHLAKNLFRYHCIRDFVGQLRSFAEAIKPGVVWCNNGHLCQEIYDQANVMLSEDLEPVGYKQTPSSSPRPRAPASGRLSPPGRLRTNTGVLRYLYEECGRATPAIVNSSHPEVFANGCTGFGMRDATVNAFLAAHAELFAAPKSLARVALVAAEMNYINRRSNWFDNLVRHHLLYDVIPVHRLEKFDLAGYDVVVLRSILFLSDAQCEQLRQFARSGGTLIATNATSLYDENWARRDDYGLADVFGVSANGENATGGTPKRFSLGGVLGHPQEYLGVPPNNDCPIDKPCRCVNSFGKGRSIFYPEAVELAVEDEPDGSAAQGLIDDIRAALRDPLVEVVAPPGLAVNLTKVAAGLVVHLVNYADTPALDISLHLTPGCLEAGCPKGAGLRLAVKVKKVAHLSGPDLPPPVSTHDGNGFAFVLPKIDKYATVLVT